MTSTLFAALTTLAEALTELVREGIKAAKRENEREEEHS